LSQGRACDTVKLLRHRMTKTIKNEAFLSELNYGGLPGAQDFPENLTQESQLVVKCIRHCEA